MRFEKIEIKNYRQYKDLTLYFTKDKKTDLHVVIASNGIGKTNLLNAIEWCLYGEEPHLGDKEEALTICNLEALDEAKAEHTNAIVSVSIRMTENGISYDFSRAVEVRAGTGMPGKEKFDVFVMPQHGNSEILSEDAAAEIVDKHLPRKIKKYFFFDGEQLYNYFGKGQDTTHVKDSIYEIAQVNIVSHVREHLQDFITKKQRELSKLNPETKKLQIQLEELQKRKENIENDIAILRTAIAEAEDTVDCLSTKIAGQESVAEDDKRYNALREEIEGLEKQRGELYSQQLNLVRKYYIFLAFFEINKETSKYIADKEARGHLPPDINRDLIIQSLNDHRCAVCNQSIDSNIQYHLEELLNKFEVSSSVSNKLMEIKNDVNRMCSMAMDYTRAKEELFSKMNALDGNIKTKEGVAEKLYQKISTCSSVAEISEWMEQKKKLLEMNKKNGEKIGSYIENCKNLDKSIDEKQREIEVATSGEKKCLELRDQINVAKETLSIVKEIETEIISDIRTRMEQETFDIFSKLIWKHNTYDHIELSEDYRLRLFHVHGDSCLGTCSAAERELLALAFTLALHKISHHDSLLFIDTPVGRVSDENRECFAKSLISVSENKQLILAFTPSEYSEEISKYFDESASSFNRLGTIDETTTINAGGVR